MKNQLNVRISSYTKNQLDQLTERLGETKTGVIALAINSIYDRTIREGEKEMNGKLTRTEAIEAVGRKAVEKVERENCEPTSRLQPDWDTTIEYKASVVCKSLKTGVQVVLDAMYYPEKSEFYDSEGDPIEDLGNINWNIDHYRVS